MAPTVWTRSGDDVQLGQAVQFVDLRSAQMRRGTLIAQHGRSATVLEDQMRRAWKISLVAIAPAPVQRDDATALYEPPPEPASPEERIGVRVGDKVTFDDGKGKAVGGTVTRINRRTASLAATDGRQWSGLRAAAPRRRRVDAAASRGPCAR